MLIRNQPIFPKLGSLSSELSQIKSRKRVAEHGEVFTPDWLVNDMLNLVAHEAERIDSRFLEPACGEGAFLAPILLRKLATVRRQYGSSPADYEFRAVLALMSIYGVELLADNVRSCRERLLTLWLTEYERRLKRPPSAECQKPSALSWNAIFLTATP